MIQWYFLTLWGDDAKTWLIPVSSSKAHSSPQQFRLVLFLSFILNSSKFNRTIFYLFFIARPAWVEWWWISFPKFESIMCYYTAAASCYYTICTLPRGWPATRAWIIIISGRLAELKEGEPKNKARRDITNMHLNKPSGQSFQRTPEIRHTSCKWRWIKMRPAFSLPLLSLWG